MKRTWLSVLLCVLGAPGARAQLIVTNDDTDPAGTNAWHVDLATCAATPLWGGAVEAWGCAADDASGVVYSNDRFGLWRWSYQGGSPVNLGIIRSAANGVFLTMSGFAFANGTLYAARGLDNGNNPEGIYSIDVATQLATPLLTWASDDYDFGGLGHNPADGLFYGTNDDTSPVGAGVYSIDALGSGSILFVTAYDGGESDVDGCAVGGGVLFAVTDGAGDPLYAFDLAGGFWLPPPCASPMPVTTIFSGGAWAPGLSFAPLAYCTAQTNSQGCVPRIGWSGTPSASAGSGFAITLSSALNNQVGHLFYGTSGRLAAPFQGGTLCVAPPLRRTPPQGSGGNPPPLDCSGSFSLDFNAWIAGGDDPALAPGARVQAQWWSHDPAAPLGASLSDAVEFVIGS